LLPLTRINACGAQPLGENWGGVIRWMKTLLLQNAVETNNFVLMDSTHAMSASDGLAINVPGYNPNFNVLARISACGATTFPKILSSQFIIVF
jgi:hypothetical protein